MQTAVTLNQGIAFPGMISKDRPTDILTGINQEADDALNFGDPVVIRTFQDQDGVKVYKMDDTAANTPRFDGFVVYDSRMEGKILNKQTVGVVRKGFIWISAGLFTDAVALAAGTQVFWDLTAGEFTQGTTAANDISPYGLVLFTSATAAQVTTGTKLLQVEVNLPSYQKIGA